jgi:hypothetical protein
VKARAQRVRARSLVIARQIDDRWGEGADLSGLGLVYRDLGDIPRARQYLSQALTIFEEIKSPRAE